MLPFAPTTTDECPKPPNTKSLFGSMYFIVSLTLLPLRTLLIFQTSWLFVYHKKTVELEHVWLSSTPETFVVGIHSPFIDFPEAKRIERGYLKVSWPCEYKEHQVNPKANF